jgi:hypothetical protein
MYSDRVKRVQRLLRVEAGYTGAIDGIMGARTLSAVARVPEVRTRPDLTRADRQLVAAGQAILASLGHDPGPVDGRWGPQTDAAYLAWSGAALPLRQADMARHFGPAGSARCTAGRVRVPWRMVLAWDPAEVITSFSCHELVAPSAQRAFDRIAAIYSPAQIEDLGLHLFGGCYNHRPKRGGSSLSTHAYGIAIDLDPERNRLNWGKDRARLAQRDAVPFWDVWAAEGWTSLGRTRDFDWMHVQAVGL